jgi:hypothetical protein
MNSSELFSLLLTATGDLQPASDTTTAELDDLRRAFLHSFEHALTPAVAASAARPEGQLAAELDYLVAQHIAAPRSEYAVHLEPRESPVRIPMDRATPDSTAAHAPVRAFGPFADRAGRLIWYDLFSFPKWLHVRAGASSDDLLILPFATLRIPVRPAAHVDIPIPAGSIWIAAGLALGSPPAVAERSVPVAADSCAAQGRSDG